MEDRTAKIGTAHYRNTDNLFNQEE